MDIPERLSRARSLSGLTLQAVKERTGIAVSTLCDFEQGKREPRFAQLAKLAEAYHKSLDYFLDDGLVVEPQVLWREKPDTGADEVEARFRQLCEQYQRLEAVNGLLREPRIQKFPGTTGEFTREKIEQCAEQVRQQLGLGRRPGREFARVLEEYAAVRVFYMQMPAGGSAACSWGDYGPAILLNAQEVSWRRNFSMAHELFHLCAWDLFTRTGDTLAVATVSEERLANMFAADLLMPADALRESVTDKLTSGKLPRERLFDIAREFDVSLSALLIQLKELYRLPVSVYRELQQWTETNRSAMGNGGTDSTIAEIRLPDRYVALADKALATGRISTNMYAKYLNISWHEASRRTDWESYIGEEIPLPAD